MKKLICFLMLLMVALITPMMAMAESVASAAVETSGFDVQTYFETLAGIVAAVVALTQLLKPLLGSSGFWTQALSWIIAIAVSCFGYLLQLGIFIGMEWYWILIYGFSSGLVANGIFDIGIVQAFINLFKPKLN